ncbi:hypothetical protein A3C18_03040 [Candidatus Kaiserbacteria bacterium RIFCSPHIGHO2_02_FULL_54_11b]|uniref:YggT family protein n=2 Tax=Candidatus Kaiseribacteriota TaxID=1752734 RepID=A0A1F6CHL0_9BACT|nr:MAG: hypothetical protein A2704_03195 [Candidatus Kaiserbacteria bacterium RIFCSPHIGHO2_01_FULL_54_36b]OGG64517.1 MAG: hypothetical protein A3C18_03040 [Candidatus Kaiserbacteria bacterium RIFCSPHIGHO2_02_FULL_54_11b]
MTELVYQRAYYYYPTLFAERVVYTVIGLIQFMLALRFVLVLLGANASAGFVAWVYSVTNQLAAPFLGAFPALNLAGFTVELSIIFAMIGYAIIGWLITGIISFISASLHRLP